FLPLTGEPYEWAQYLLLGLAFPLILLAAARAPQSPLSSVGAVVKLGLALAGLLAGMYFVPRGDGVRSLTLLLVGIQLLTLLTIGRVSRGPWACSCGLPWEPSTILVGGAVLGLAWGVAIRWVWWSPRLVWLTPSPYVIVVILISIILASAAVARTSL